MNIVYKKCVSRQLPQFKYFKKAFIFIFASQHAFAMLASSSGPAEHSEQIRLPRRVVLDIYRALHPTIRQKRLRKTALVATSFSIFYFINEINIHGKNGKAWVSELAVSLFDFARKPSKKAAAPGA